MPIRYEYNSTCCSHFYMETRKPSDAQVVTKCNVCAQGEYVLSNEVVLEDVPEPAPQVATQEVHLVSEARQKLLALGLTEEEIDLLIQEITTEE